MPIYVCMSYILSSLVQFRYLVTGDQVFVKVTYFKKIQWRLVLSEYLVVFN